MSSNEIPPHPGWTHYFDQDENCYYVNNANGTTQWTHPFEEGYSYEPQPKQTTQDKNSVVVASNSAAESLLANSERYYDSSGPVSTIPQSTSTTTTQGSYYNQQQPSPPTSFPSDLPPNWFRILDPRSRTYFYNSLTHEVQWINPTTGVAGYVGQKCNVSELPDGFTVHADHQAVNAIYTPPSSFPVDVDYLSNIQAAADLPDYEHKLEQTTSKDFDVVWLKANWGGCCDAITRPDNGVFVLRSCIVSLYFVVTLALVVVGIVLKMQESTHAVEPLIFGCMFFGMASLISIMVCGCWVYTNTNSLAEVKLLQLACNWKPIKKSAIFDRIAEYQAHEPSLTITVNCYHLDERPVSGSYTVHAGGYQVTRTYRYLEKYRVSTSMETYTVPIVAWVDTSPQNLEEAFAAIKPEAVYTQLTYDQSYLVLPEQQNMVLDLKALLYNRHVGRDTHCEVTEHYHGPDASLSNESTVQAPPPSDGVATPLLFSYQIPDLVINNPSSTRAQIARVCCFNPLSATLGLVVMGLWFPAAIAYRTLFYPLRYHSLKTLYFGTPSWCNQIKDGDSNNPETEVTNNH